MKINRVKIIQYCHHICNTDLWSALGLHYNFIEQKPYKNKILITFYFYTIGLILRKILSIFREYLYYQVNNVRYFEVFKIQSNFHDIKWISRIVSYYIFPFIIIPHCITYCYNIIYYVYDCDNYNIYSCIIRVCFNIYDL